MLSNPDPWINGLGWLAGLLVMSSGLPNVIANLRSRERPQPSLLRDGMQLTGNLCWALYGALLGITSIATICAINSLLMLVLIGQQMTLRKSIMTIQEGSEK